MRWRRKKTEAEKKLCAAKEAAWSKIPPKLEAATKRRRGPQGNKVELQPPPASPTPSESTRKKPAETPVPDDPMGFPSPVGQGVAVSLVPGANPKENDSDKKRHKEIREQALASAKGPAIPVRDPLGAAASSGGSSAVAPVAPTTAEQPK